MSYQVIARKWRPQNFDEVVFQDHVSRTIKNSIQAGRISHAYLFSGPRGVGKTTMARILAKAVNCVEGPTPAPCGKCSNCIEIKNGSAFDVIEIDGASNRGIEDIRELRENVNFAPVKGRYKVYIIDEVHMLTKEAFNALLKTLEEPPAHVIFIFATTEVHQIPDTIMSRCQKFFFKKIPIDAIVEHIKLIVAKEGYRISENALYPIARTASGSMRDAQSLLDQVISFSQAGGEEVEIGEEDALAILGIVPVESYIRQLGNIIDAHAASAMEEIERVVVMGVDIPRYAAGLIDIIRTIRLLKNGISIKELLGLSPEEISHLSKVAEKFYDEELRLIFHIANEMQNDLRYAQNERINLEMALLDLIGVRNAPSLASIIKRLGSEGAGPTPRTAEVKQKSSPAAVVSIPVSPEKKNETQQPPPPASGVKDLSMAWSMLMGEVAEKKQYLLFILKPAVIECKDNVLAVQYPAGADHEYYARVLDEKHRTFMQDELSRITGRSIIISVTQSKTHEVTQPTANAGMRADKPHAVERKNDPDDNVSIPPPDDEMLKKPETTDYESVNPAVEKLKNVFHGHIVKKGDSKC